MDVSPHTHHCLPTADIVSNVAEASLQRLNTHAEADEEMRQENLPKTRIALTETIRMMISAEPPQ